MTLRSATPAARRQSALQLSEELIGPQPQPEERQAQHHIGGHGNLIVA
jgi:hypothetical protein